METTVTPSEAFEIMDRVVDHLQLTSGQPRSVGLDYSFQNSMDVLRKALNDRAWQPIETAPKNIPVLVYCRDCSGAYSDISPATYNTYAYKDGGYWSWECEYEVREIYPTHWMPLPDPPSIAK